MVSCFQALMLSCILRSLHFESLLQFVCYELLFCAPFCFAANNHDAPAHPPTVAHPPIWVTFIPQATHTRTLYTDQFLCNLFFLYFVPSSSFVYIFPLFYYSCCLAVYISCTVRRSTGCSFHSCCTPSPSHVKFSIFYCTEIQCFRYSLPVLLW